MASAHDSWHRLIEALAHGVLISDSNGEIIYVNAFAAKLFGRTPNELIGRIFSYPIATNQTQEIEIIQPNGETLTIKMAIKKGGWENLYAWIISLEDINNLKLNEKLLDLSSTAFNSSIEGIIITDENQLLLQVNKSFLSMTGYRLEDILGKSPKTFFQSGVLEENFYHTLWERLNKTGHWSGKMVVIGKNNEALPMFLSIITIQNNDGDITNYIGFFYDLRQEKKIAGKIEYAKTYDFLTALPNIYTLVNNLDRYIREYSSEEGSFTILTIRVSEPEENYRFFNDDIDARNNIILELVKRIDRSTKHKKLLSRTGIRVFTVVYLSKLPLYSMQALAKTIIDKVTQPYYLNSQEYNLVCNIGIARNEKNTITNAETLLQHAEAANHSAMQKGENKIAIYDPGAESIVLSFNRHLDSVRQALQDNQFEMYYQPKVDLLQDKVIGLEALIRWRLPDGSILTPAQFLLNQMDNHPISMEIGAWVQHAVLQQAEKLIQEQLYTSISINISPYQLKQEGFATELETVLLKFPNVPGSMIKLEILETAALDDLTAVNQIIKSCRPLGVKFSLDDFGTGYSSLTYLKELDIDEVKLDQSFIRNCIHQTEDMIVLKSTIDLCNMLGRPLIAEGVETNLHAKMLLNLCCPRMQGYAFARPMSAASIITWLKTWKPEPSLKQKRFSTAELESLIKQDIQHYINFNAIHYYLNDKNIPLIDFNYSSCKFGQWLTEHQHIFKNTTIFKRFDNLHKLIHKQAIEIIELANNGKEAQANSALLKLIKSRRDFIYQLIKSVYE